LSLLVNPIVCDVPPDDKSFGLWGAYPKGGEAAAGKGALLVHRRQWGTRPAIVIGDWLQNDQSPMTMTKMSSFVVWVAVFSHQGGTA